MLARGEAERLAEPLVARSATHEEEMKRNPCSIGMGGRSRRMYEKIDEIM